jgi:hypothetical protein
MRADTPEHRTSARDQHVAFGYRLAKSWAQLRRGAIRAMEHVPTRGVEGVGCRLHCVRCDIPHLRTASAAAIRI